MDKFCNFFFLIIFTLFLGCKGPAVKEKVKFETIKSDYVVSAKPHDVNSHYASNKLRDRIAVPNNYKRASYSETSFGNFLQNLELKPEASLVKYYNGSTKPKQGVYLAVVDLDIGDKDLHQCADAVMRLRAEYLWAEARYDDIKFNFTNGHEVAYSEWMNGKRMQINGNKTQWTPKESASNTYQDLWNYLELIFMYAGTASLEKELDEVKLFDVEIGDVLIQGGFPGHAVIVVDKAIHELTGEKVFLLAQSYMPAQELQILINPNDMNLSPWYQSAEGEILTPEWVFDTSDFGSFTSE